MGCKPKKRKPPGPPWRPAEVLCILELLWVLPSAPCRWLTKLAEKDSAAGNGSLTVIR